MSPTWQSDEAPAPVRLGPRGVLRAVLRGLPLALVLILGLSLLLALRLIERPVFGAHRPWTPWITVVVCRIALRLIGLPVVTEGAPGDRPGVIVANHSSWLDIFVLNAARPLYFVSKSEVAAWPGIGWLARATGTVFVTRDRAQADLQRQIFEDRLRAGHQLLFFPEGTSSDGCRVLPFKPTLFAALYSPDLPGLSVQPVTVVYEAPEGADPRHYGWWGDMEFGGHLLAMLGSARHGRVRVVWHGPLNVTAHGNRKALAAAAEAAVRGAHPG
ncbi:MAG: 1-acyl-sn-glycerol-3-phosphate acyltransferase [Silicimonas sp.]|nr:1-acyl-sn-glycerol-3-phosphate acyltransferase [Silicimonas sp.]